MSNSNIMSYRTDVRYLVFYIVSFQKWQSTNNILNHYRQQSSANADLHYHSGMVCHQSGATVWRSESPHPVLWATCFSSNMKGKNQSGWHGVLGSHDLWPSSTASHWSSFHSWHVGGRWDFHLSRAPDNISNMWSVFIWVHHHIVGHGKFPNLHSADYKVRHAEAIRKIAEPAMGTRCRWWWAGVPMVMPTH